MRKTPRKYRKTVINPLSDLFLRIAGHLGDTNVNDFEVLVACVCFGYFDGPQPKQTPIKESTIVVLE